MPLQATSGAASYDAFGGGVAAVPNYIEDVFSTWLYPSISGDNQIVNNIDLSGKGGLVWIKSRDRASNHYLIDTVRGSSVGDTKSLSSNTTTAQTSGPNLDWVQFNNNGFTAKAVAGGGELGTNTFYGNMVSWTFREQPKFFDVVTYTGNGATTRTINHNLASVPGCILIKATSTTSDWWVTHRNNGTDAVYGSLNLTAAMNPYGDPMTRFATSTEFYPRLMDSSLNTNGVTYVAYLFAHNAGGFGLSGTDNVISCGSFTSTGSVLSVNLGYEPQWLLYKESSINGDWKLIDNMRGFQVDRNGSTVALYPNLSSAESALGLVGPTSTGFTFDNGGSGVTYIYIAIRRGSMRTPTTGTSVFLPATWTGNNTTGRNIPTGFPVDLTIEQIRTASSIQANLWFDRLRGYSSTITGASAFLRSQVTDAESSLPDYNYVPTMDGFNFGSTASLTTQFNNSGVTAVAWNFRRAPGFFDEVCYTGNSTAGRQVQHNLGVVPELLIVKDRSQADGWRAYAAPLGAGFLLQPNSTAAAFASFATWNNTSPTASVFSLGAASAVNYSGDNYVAYLFASCPGVSKVGSFTGTGATQVINCGFTGGARFVLIKATSTTGDWYVWDSARGIVAGNDPYLVLNATSNAAEVTGTDWVDTAATGFELSNAGGNLANSNGVSYIFLAIA